MTTIADNTDLETLWHEHSRNIYGYIFKVVRDHTVTEDLVSTVYLRVAVAISNGHGPDKHEVGWLFAIARNILIDHWRAMRRVTFIDIDSMAEHPADDPSPLEVCERCRIVEQVRGAVERLPSVKQTDAMHLMLDGYDNREIGTMLQMTDKAVRQTHVRARRSLREWLGVPA